MDVGRLRQRIAGLAMGAAAFVSPARVEQTARGWLARFEPMVADPARKMLLVAKAGIVDAELAKLGLRLRTRKGTAGRRVLQDAFQQWHEAVLGFEYTPGVGHDR